MRRRPLLSIAALVISSATLLAQGQREQAPSTGSGQAPQFRAGVELIQLDVVVLDGKRHPVSGLTAADFTVLDDGTPTPIRAFTPIQLATRTPATEAVWANEVAPDVVTNQVGEQEGRLVIILMDRTIPANEPTVAAKKIATAAVEALGPNDLGAVVSTANGAVQNQRVQDLTSDRTRLLRAINSGDPATSWSPDAEVIMGKNDPLTDPRCLCGVCVHETIQRVAEAVQNTPRRRKLLLFIGSDLTWQAANKIATAATRPCELTLKDARAAMFAAVDRANLTIHSIDPQGLVNLGPQTQGAGRGGFDRPQNSGPSERLRQQQEALGGSLSQRQNLAVLPARTGGRTVVARNNPELVVADIYRETEAYYVLGVERVASTRPDGTRSIEVKMARKGLTAYAQRQYGPAPKSGMTASIASGAAAAVAPVDALSGLLPSATVPLSLTVVPFADPAGGKPIVRVNVDAGALAAADGKETPLEISILIVDRTGKRVASAKQTSTVSAQRSASGAVPEVNVLSQVQLEPGDYGIRVGVSDPAGRIASVFADTTVPKFDDAALSLSGVSVEVPAASGAAMQTTRRTFARTDQVRAVMQIYQGTQRTDALAPVSVRVQILDAKGAAVRDQSLPFAETAFANRRADCVITLPIAQLPAGAYLLKLEASTSRATSGRALRFDVR